jgi:hypothetical protein
MDGIQPSMERCLMMKRGQWSEALPDGGQKYEMNNTFFIGDRFYSIPWS